jgi:HPt (histidine-containing phosphotransfer) domain-containing protein
MTANALQGDRDRYLALGMDDYISKPVTATSLVAALAHCPPRLDQPSVPAVAVSVATDFLGDLPAPQLAAMQQTIADLRTGLGAGGDDLLRDLTADFAHNGVELIERMRQAVAQGRAGDLRLAAHTLKSTSATFGAMALSEVARDLEKRGKAGELDRAGALIDQAEAGLAQAGRALAQAWSVERGA